MKKTTILLLGALIASAMPGNGLKAQNTPVALRVKTLDRAALTSAKVYAATDLDGLYCVDAAHLHSLFTGTATALADVATSMDMAMARMDDGSWRVYQNVPTDTYDTAFVVLKDANDVYYVYGIASPQQRDTGIFKACEFLTSVTTDSTVNPAHIVFSAPAVVCSSNGFSYSSLTTAVDSVNPGAVITVERSFIASPLPDANTIVSKPVEINLNGFEVSGNIYLNNTSDSVIIRDGKLGTITTSDASASGAVRLSDVEANNLNANQHSVVVTGGKFRTLTGVNASNTVVYGGKFGSDISPLLANRHVQVANTDADAVAYPYTVAEGYLVTFVNYNGRIGQPGYADSTAIINTADNRIVPAPARPAYVGADTIFGHYWTNAAYTTPWLFDQHVLTSDTTLYAKWDVYDASTKVKITVNHRLQNIARNAYETYDSVTYVMDMDSDPTNVATFFAFGIRGFHPVVGLLNVPLTVDANVDFLYNRDTVVFVWDLNGGTLEDQTFATTQVLPYQDTVALMPAVRKTGHYAGQWNYDTDFALAGIVSGQPVATPVVVPALIDTIRFKAAFERKPAYPVTWNDFRDTIKVVYNGEDRSNELTATFVDDDNATQTLALTFAQGSAVVTPRNAGTYNVTASFSDTNYLLANTSKVLLINPCPAVAGGVWVDSVKRYDGSRDVENWEVSARLVNPAPFGTDSVAVHVDSVLYSDATVGTGKTIIAYLGTAYGPDAANYVISNSYSIVTTNGVIVPVHVVDADAMDADVANGTYVGINGFCAGDESVINYYLAAGSNTPDQYKLLFDDAAKAAGFVDVDWTNIVTAGDIDIDVPEDVERGIYHASLYFRNSAYVQYETTPGEFDSPARAITFGVKLTRQYTRPLFDDVITIIDTCHCIDQNSVQWYENGVLVASGPYYQKVGGFVDGDSYFASFNFVGETETVFTCPQDSLGMDNKPVEPASSEATVSVYPNPTADYATVQVEHPTQFSHTIRVMNVMGVNVFEGTFNGSTTTIDFSRFGNGSYTVSVDGIVVRVIKK